jgi:alpha-beta hydrolase superfamily lysophospholipase
MRYRLVFAFVYALSAVTSAATPDYPREQRLATDVVSQIVAGETVWLSLPARPRVLAIYSVPRGTPKGAVILIHGLGANPESAPIGALRTALADRGYATLAVQMPVLAEDALPESYRDLLGDAGDRIAIAIAWLHAKGFAKVAIVSHSFGATMTDAYLARRDVMPPTAWISVGMLVDFTALPRAPVLDVVAERDLPRVLAASKLRMPHLPHDGCSKPLSIADTNHLMNGATTPLADAIAAFIDRVFTGSC